MENYEAIHDEMLKMTGTESLNHYYDYQPCGPYFTEYLTIDNSAHEADDLVMRMVSYVDCLFEEMRREESAKLDELASLEANGEWTGSLTPIEEVFFDKVTFEADGKRAELDILKLSKGEEPAWMEWLTLRQRFLAGRDLKVEYWSAEEGGKAPDDLRIWNLMADLLADGRLAHCVTLKAVSDNNLIYDNYEELDAIAHRHFYVNGMWHGAYLCGEVPFVQDEPVVRSISNWRQSTEYGCESEWFELDAGFSLRMDVNTDPVIIEKAYALADKFKASLDCKVYKQLSPLDIPTEDSHERAAEFLAYFAQLRANLTDAEAAEIAGIERFSRVQELFTKHAGDEYTAEEVALYRFGIAALTLKGWADHYAWKQEAFEKYGLINTMIPPLPEALKALADRIGEALPEGELKQYPIALGDFLNVQWDAKIGQWSAVEQISQGGMRFNVSDIRLHSIEDIDTLEALLNETAAYADELPFEEHESEGSEALNRAIEAWLGAFASAEEDDPERDDAQAGPEEDDPLRDGFVVVAPGMALRLGGDLMEGSQPVWEGKGCNAGEGSYKLLQEAMNYSGLPDDILRCLECGDEVLTNREYYQRLLDGRIPIYCNTGCLVPEDITFECTDEGTIAQLRFRRENGRYIHEVAVLD